MYREHFGLREAPFGLTPDTAYFLNRSGYQDALNVLLVALRSGEGFVKVVGEVGTGKTLLCRKLINILGGEFVTAYLHNPYLEPGALLDAVASELEVPGAGSLTQHETLKRLSEHLIALHRSGRRVVLCLDEVQAMPIQTLEVMRLLTNLETEKRKLLQVVLFGQPELDELLAQPSVRQLRQRITFAYRLLPMTRAALDGYVAHRLAVAGYSGRGLFDRRALDRMYVGSQGVPRLINVICHKSLMAAFGQGRHRVSARMVDAALRDTGGGRRAAWLTPRWLAPGALLAGAGIWWVAGGG